MITFTDGIVFKHEYIYNWNLSIDYDFELKLPTSKIYDSILSFRFLSGHKSITKCCKTYISEIIRHYIATIIKIQQDIIYNFNNAIPDNIFINIQIKTVLN